MRDVLEAASAAEEAGFDGIWTWDHLAGSVHGRDRVLECWTTLTAIATAVPRVSIGPLVLNVANRHPGVLAVMAATLQELSRGRLLLGIGAGGGVDLPYASEQYAIGRPVGTDPARRAAVVDAIRDMRQVWSGAASSALGTASGFLRSDPAPPVIVGAFGSKMAQLAGEFGDGINTPAGPALASLAHTARGAFAQRGGEPRDFVVTTSGRLDERAVDSSGPEWQRLEAIGVERLILHVPAPYDVGRIRAVGAARLS
jgi:alkanesulfonate monooxygenase SsuD/methylene tetrahydromethanopterin reductase-like flavin-dependent oxidoreductase (luciferase family)